MDRFAKLAGRKYKAFDYIGAKDAQKIIIIMGSGAGAAQEAVDKMNVNGEKSG